MNRLLTLTMTAFMMTHCTLAQSVIKVWGSEDSLAIVAQVRHCLHQLDVRQRVNLQLRFCETMPKNLSGITIVQPTLASSEEKLIKVWIKAQMSSIQQRFILAHEMIHVKQYVKGELSIIDQQHVLWKGKTYKHQRLVHRNTPWEREAFRFHHQLAKIIKNSPLEPLMVSRTERKP